MGCLEYSQLVLTIEYLGVRAKVFQGALPSLAGERVPSKKARLRQLVQPRTREPGCIAFIGLVDQFNFFSLQNLLQTASLDIYKNIRDL